MPVLAAGCMTDEECINKKEDRDETNQIIDISGDGGHHASVVPVVR